MIVLKKNKKNHWKWWDFSHFTPGWRTNDRIGNEIILGWKKKAESCQVDLYLWIMDVAEKKEDRMNGVFQFCEWTGFFSMEWNRFFCCRHRERESYLHTRKPDDYPSYSVFGPIGNNKGLLSYTAWLLCRWIPAVRGSRGGQLFQGVCCFSARLLLLLLLDRKCSDWSPPPMRHLSTTGLLPSFSPGGVKCFWSPP